MTRAPASTSRRPHNGPAQSADRSSTRGTADRGARVRATAPAAGSSGLRRGARHACGRRSSAGARHAGTASRRHRGHGERQSVRRGEQLADVARAYRALDGRPGLRRRLDAEPGPQHLQVGRARQVQRQPAIARLDEAAASVAGLAAAARQAHQAGAFGQAVHVQSEARRRAARDLFEVLQHRTGSRRSRRNPARSGAPAAGPVSAIRPDVAQSSAGARLMAHSAVRRRGPSRAPSWRPGAGPTVPSRAGGGGRCGARSWPCRPRRGSGPSTVPAARVACPGTRRPAPPPPTPRCPRRRRRRAGARCCASRAGRAGAPANAACGSHAQSRRVRRRTELVQVAAGAEIRPVAAQLERCSVGSSQAAASASTSASRMRRIERVAPHRVGEVQRQDVALPSASEAMGRIADRGRRRPRRACAQPVAEPGAGEQRRERERLEQQRLVERQRLADAQHLAEHAGGERLRGEARLELRHRRRRSSPRAHPPRPATARGRPPAAGRSRADQSFVGVAAIAASAVDTRGRQPGGRHR